MIKEGCLDGVDEVYGYHNVPNFNEGEIRIIPGAIMAKVCIVRINIYGQGGHGAMPHKIQDVVTATAHTIENLHTVKSRCIDSKENFVFTICHVDSGHAHNVYPDKSFMEGTIRCYN